MTESWVIHPARRRASESATSANPEAKIRRPGHRRDAPLKRGMLTLFTLPFELDWRWFSGQINWFLGIMSSQVSKSRPGAPKNGKTSLSETCSKIARNDPSYKRLKQGNRLK
jgi:hypothetical protein